VDSLDFLLNHFCSINFVLSFLFYHFSYELDWWLGFGTRWIQLSAALKDSVTSRKDYLLPLPNLSFSSSQIIFNGYVWPNLFDGFIVDSKTNVPLNSHIPQIIKYGRSGQFLEDFITGFESSSESINAAAAVYSLVTSGPSAIKFATSDPSIGNMNLATFRNFYAPGSTIAHLDQDTYVNTADFLMIPTVANITGQTLDDLTAKHPSKYGPIGPGLLAILQSMGWPTKEAPNPIYVTLAKDVMMPGNSSAGSWSKLSMILTISCLLSVIFFFIS